MFEGGEIVDLTKENWRMLKTTIYEIDTTKYKVELIKTDSLIKTRVFIENSGVDIQSTFKLINKKWYLITHIDYFN
jgi:hypothetical protein